MLREALLFFAAILALLPSFSKAAAAVQSRRTPSRRGAAASPKKAGAANASPSSEGKLADLKKFAGRWALVMGGTVMPSAEITIVVHDDSAFTFMGSNGLVFERAQFGQLYDGNIKIGGTMEIHAKGTFTMPSPDEIVGDMIYTNDFHMTLVAKEIWTLKDDAKMLAVISETEVFGHVNSLYSRVDEQAPGDGPVSAEKVSEKSSPSPPQRKSTTAFPRRASTRKPRN